MNDTESPDHFLKYWREHRRLTQTELGSRAGTVQQHIAKLERGERQLQPGIGRRLATALGISLRQLYFGPDEPSDDEVMLIRAIRKLPASRRNALLEITGALEETADAAAPAPQALLDAAAQTGETLGPFDARLWDGLDGFAESELAKIEEIGRTSPDLRAPMVATLYLLAQKDVAIGLRPDYARFRLFIHGQASALRAAGRNQPQA